MSDCCKGGTYKCDKCRGKFCNRCQSSRDYGDQELCYDCYYKVLGQDAENTNKEDRRKDEMIAELKEALESSRDENDKRFHHGRESAFTEAKEYLESQPEPLDKNKMLSDLQKYIYDAAREGCIIQ